jgi:cytochrome c peroxidase
MYPRAVFPFLLMLLLVACSAPQEPAVPADPIVRYKLQTLGEISYPADNQKNKDRAVLGWRLFYDPILSGTQEVACGTCHHARFGMSDGRALSLGVQSSGLGPGRFPIGPMRHETGRHSPSVINAAYSTPLFWDGRAKTLEEQSLFPVRDLHEMLGPGISPKDAIDSAIVRLRRIKLYEIYFSQAFAPEADSVSKGSLPSAITPSSLARALASFQRLIVSKNSKYDRFVRREEALNAIELQGLQLFHGKANCASCHSGPMLSDFKFYGQGIGSLNDQGAGQHRFRTPSLRNLELTAPYMHDGSLKTIDEVIDYYDRGSPANPALSIDPRFKPLGLTQVEKQALKAFLLTLRDDSWEDVAVPPSVVPSNLDVPR